MMIVEIRDATVERYSGRPNEKTGEVRVRQKQRGWAHIPGRPYPVEIAFNLPDDAAPYKAGKYTVNGRSLTVDKWGGLTFTFAMHLDPVEVRQ